MSWNNQVQTDKTIPGNEPDVVMHDNEKGPYLLIDSAVVGDMCGKERSRNFF